MHTAIAALTGGLLLAITGTTPVTAEVFPFETIRLARSDIGNFSAIQFGNLDHARSHGGATPQCRAFPGSEDWPTEADWKQLNISLGGALLRPIPLGSVCYEGPNHNASTCSYLVNQSGRTRLWLDDPLSTLTQWPQGNTCTPSLSPVGNCTRGGSPEYVVNATTVKQIQAAINFARNKNVRVVIKNTGHDFGGRSTGAGSLSVWVHNLKSFEFIANYTSDVYSGMAVHIGAGMESWEMFNHMAANGNISVMVPGGATVGSVGGWLAAGGHGILASKYGLGADNALSINVITADGRFLTADSTTNKDLFWALRGGGPSTYGIMTSVVLKAYPPISLVNIPINFSVNNSSLPNGNNTSPIVLTNTETFWQGIKLVLHFSTKITDAGGLTYSFIYPTINSSARFTMSYAIPGIDPQTFTTLLQPLFTNLSKLGTNITNPPLSSTPYSGTPRPPAFSNPVETRYRSRLFPRHNWQNNTLFNQTFSVIRESIEAGYTFHGIGYGVTRQVAGSPGANSAVNPAWRTAVLHASLMEIQPEGLTAQEARERDAKVRRYLDLWRAVTPGSGAYLNEGDPAEPNWQQSFFGGGGHYTRLLGVKRRYDPWGVFWARTTVGSEGWEVRGEGGYPFSQNGRLCRVGEEGEHDEDEEREESK